MPEYIISVGNSTTGPIGFVARLSAKNPDAALAMLKEYLPEWHPLMSDPIHINIYFNDAAITVADVEEEDR